MSRLIPNVGNCPKYAAKREVIKVTNDLRASKVLKVLKIKA